MKKIIILFLVFIMGTCAFALDVYKLDNGQTVIIKPVKNNPIVTVDTWIKTGSINETEKNQGVSHFLEHLFFKGSSKYPSGEFDKILESKGAITNAATSKDFTHYYITIPSKYFAQAVEMHADMLLNPQIPRKEMEKERKVVLEEISKDLNSPNEIVYQNLIELMYTNHPYKRKVIGTSQVIENITREEILDYYNTFYTPSNMVTLIVGDVDEQKALELVKTNFATSNPKKTVHPHYKSEEILKIKKQKIEYFPTQSGYLLMGFRGVPITDKDTYALDVLSTIMGDGRSSKLYQIIKEQKQLAYAISASNSSYRDDGLFYIRADFMPDNLEKLEKAIFSEISKIQIQGVSDEELDIAKSIIERDTFYARESISNIASEIGYTVSIAGNVSFYNDYLKEIKKVTASDVKRVANKYLGENKVAESIMLPLDRQNKIVQDKNNVNYDSNFVSKNSETEKYILQNGTTMLLTQNDFNDIVAISLWAKGGNFLETIPGTASLVASTMMKGTKNYSAIDFVKTLEENGIRIEPSVSGDAFSINILTTKTQLDLTLKMLDEVLNNATFDDYEIEKNRTTQINNIKKSRDIPVNNAAEIYKTLLYENSPYSNTGIVLEKTLPKVRRDDIIKYYQTVFSPQNVIVSINGNVDKQYIINRLTEILKTKKNSKFTYDSYFASIPTLKHPKSATKKIHDLQTAWTIIGWQTSGALNTKDYATLQVIDTLLGSGMSSRLFKSLRENEGLAYQVGSNFSPNVLKGTFYVYIGTNPKTLDKSKQMMLSEVYKLKNEFVGDEELQSAKDKLIGNYIIALETNQEKASTLGWFEASGRGYKFKDNYIDLINNVTSSDILEVANKYFNSKVITSSVEKE